MGATPRWIGFHLLVLALVALDLGVFHRRARVIPAREAVAATAGWLAVALAFAAGIFFFMGPQQALDFSTGYVIEYALSVDNIFVFIVLFRYFQVPPESQHGVLVWGIIGALLMRGALVGAGAALLHRFSWALAALGALVLCTGMRMLLHKPEDMKPGKNPAVCLAPKLIPLTLDFRGHRFFVRENGRRLATPLLLVLLAVEATDAVFAVDSVPAIFAITREPFIVYTSNILAVLGLRSLYFVFAGLLPYFRYLSQGLAAVLMFIGGKMLAERWIHISTAHSLLVVAAILAVSVAASGRARRTPESMEGRAER